MKAKRPSLLLGHPQLKADKKREGQNKTDFVLLTWHTRLVISGLAGKSQGPQWEIQNATSGSHYGNSSNEPQE